MSQRPEIDIEVARSKLVAKLDRGPWLPAELTLENNIAFVQYSKFIREWLSEADQILGEIRRKQKIAEKKARNQANSRRF
jgi:hypothetical protein